VGLGIVGFPTGGVSLQPEMVATPKFLIREYIMMSCLISLYQNVVDETCPPIIETLVEDLGLALDPKSGKDIVPTITAADVYLYR